jgi:hypothetical protein
VHYHHHFHPGILVHPSNPVYPVDPENPEYQHPWHLEDLVNLALPNPEYLEVLDNRPAPDTP